VIKSLVFGLLQTYYRQNKKQSDFDNIVKQLFQRLLARGHSYESIHPIFLEATSKIDSHQNAILNSTTRGSIHTTPRLANIRKKQKDKDRSDVFFHLPYHPRDVSRKQIQEIYKNTCENDDNLGESYKRMTTQSGSTMRISKLTIAYSRAKNLRDLLCSSTLKNLDNYCLGFSIILSYSSGGCGLAQVTALHHFINL
jgi:hypothetical protein